MCKARRASAFGCGGNALDFNFDVGLDIDPLFAGQPCVSVVHPLADLHACCVYYSNALIAFVPFARPECAFPPAEALDFALGQAQAVEGVEEASVVWEAAEAFPVRPVGVV